MARILVVDDAEDICILLKKTLERDGDAVVTVRSADEMARAGYQNMDLILLDIMMSGEDGFSICRRIRGEVDCPILFLTAKETEEDVLCGFGLGADDYITKPFRLSELRARVGAHLRREKRVPVHRITDGVLSFDLSGKTLYVNGKELVLTKAQYNICEELARHPGLVYSREQLLEAVFGFHNDSDTSAITEHIKNIRAKLAAVQLSPIETVWGMGYKWKKQSPPV